MDRLDAKLRELAEAVEADDLLHGRESTLEERIRSRERLVALRAEIADLRRQLVTKTAPEQHR